MKDVGEPGDREGHARIDGGWLETGTKATVAEMGSCVGNAWDERRDLPPDRTAPAAYPTQIRRVQVHVQLPEVLRVASSRALDMETTQPNAMEDSQAEDHAGLAQHQDWKRRALSSGRYSGHQIPVPWVAHPQSVGGNDPFQPNHR